MNVDVGGKHRDDDGVGASGHFGHILCENRGRSVHHDMPCIGRDSHLPRARHSAVALVGGNAVNEGLLRFSLLQPAGARSLGVIVTKQRTVSQARKITGEVGRYRRFSRTALWVQDENSLHVDEAYAAIDAMASL